MSSTYSDYSDPQGMRPVGCSPRADERIEATFGSPNLTIQSSTPCGAGDVLPLQPSSARASSSEAMDYDNFSSPTREHRMETDATALISRAFDLPQTGQIDRASAPPMGVPSFIGLPTAEASVRPRRSPRNPQQSSNTATSSGRSTRFTSGRTRMPRGNCHPAAHVRTPSGPSNVAGTHVRVETTSIDYEIPQPTTSDDPLSAMLTQLAGGRRLTVGGAVRSILELPRHASRLFTEEDYLRTKRIHHYWSRLVHCAQTASHLPVKRYDPNEDSRYREIAPSLSCARDLEITRDLCFVTWARQQCKVRAPAHDVTVSSDDVAPRSYCMTREEPVFPAGWTAVSKLPDVRLITTLLYSNDTLAVLDARCKIMDKLIPGNHPVVILSDDDAYTALTCITFKYSITLIELIMYCLGPAEHAYPCYCKKMMPAGKFMHHSCCAFTSALCRMYGLGPRDPQGYIALRD